MLTTRRLDDSAIRFRPSQESSHRIALHRIALSCKVALPPVVLADSVTYEINTGTNTGTNTTSTFQYYLLALGSGSYCTKSSRVDLCHSTIYRLPSTVLPPNLPTHILSLSDQIWTTSGSKVEEMVQRFDSSN